MVLAATAAGLLAAAVLLGGVEGAVRAPSLAVLLPLLVLTGLSIAPAVIIVGNLVDEQAPRSRLSEAQAWLATAYTAGGAGGTAVAGLLVDAGGPGAACSAPVCSWPGGALAAVAAQPVWRRGAAATRAVMHSFGSDNHSGVHPEVLAAIADANQGHAPAYGADPVTERGIAAVRAHLGGDAEVAFVFNGTGANLVGLGLALLPWQHAICAESAHIAVDECGAPERLLGAKLVTLPTPDGKLTPELVHASVTGVGDEHRTQPGAVSITQSTECGTVYTPDEIRALADAAHDLGAVLHLDGARIANAAASLGVPLAATTADCGVDVLSFGGTKNGLLGGEAVVVLTTRLATAWPTSASSSASSAARAATWAPSSRPCSRATCGCATRRTPTRWPGASRTASATCRARRSPGPSRRTPSSCGCRPRSPRRRPGSAPTRPTRSPASCASCARGTPPRARSTPCSPV